MSTKITISYDREDKLKYHLYQECYENNNVWFQLDDAKEFEVCRDGDSTSVRVAIPVGIFRHMVDGWLKSEWGKDPTMDNYQVTAEDFEAGIEYLEKIVADKNKNR